MATYYITAIDKNTVGTHTYIDRVLLHEVVENKIRKGIVKNKDEVIKLIKEKNIIYSAIWDYKNIGWDREELVSYELRGGKEYLRTKPDNTQRDNLLHLLPLANLGI